MFKWYLLFCTVLVACSKSDLSKKSICYQYPTEIVCDFENVNSSGFTTSNEYIFKNKNTQTQLHSFSGKFGFKVNTQNKYGATIKIKVEPGDILDVSIKRYKNGSNSPLIIAIDEGKFHSIHNTASFDENWDILQKRIPVFTKLDSSQATIFTTFNSKDTVPGYFDDFKISIFRRNDTIPHPIYTNQVDLSISKHDLEKINRSRKLAFKAGIINDSLKKWHPVQWNINNEEINGFVKIKGDWTEHLETDKWGLKLKLKDKFYGSKRFSLMKPNSRSGIREYLFHKVLIEHKILTTNYSFMGVSINKTNKGLFALEEHFEKAYLKKRKLPLGPIFKINESHLWKGREKAFYTNIYEEEGGKDYHQKSKLKNYIKCNDSISINGRNLLNSFRNGQIPVREAFDLEYISKYFAIANILSAHHALIWHNSRFYYNPTTKKLYPIAYDGYSHDNYLIRDGFIGDSSNQPSSKWLNLFLNDKEFQIQFKQDLSFFSTEKYIDSLINGQQDDLNDKIKLIQREECVYTENFEYIIKNAAVIRQRLLL